MEITTVLIIVVAVLAVALLGGLVLVLRDPGAVQRRIEAVFRRPDRPARTAGDEQYYRPYWSR